MSCFIVRRFFLFTFLIIDTGKIKRFQILIIWRKKKRPIGSVCLPLGLFSDEIEENCMGGVVGLWLKSKRGNYLFILIKKFKKRVQICDKEVTDRIINMLLKIWQKKIIEFSFLFHKGIALLLYLFYVFKFLLTCQ